MVDSGFRPEVELICDYGILQAGMRAKLVGVRSNGNYWVWTLHLKQPHNQINKLFDQAINVRGDRGCYQTGQYIYSHKWEEDGKKVQAWRIEITSGKATMKFNVISDERNNLVERWLRCNSELPYVNWLENKINEYER